jgi:hypothetical protein
MYFTILSWAREDNIKPWSIPGDTETCVYSWLNGQYGHEQVLLTENPRKVASQLSRHL